jgi:hypothetical protein
VPAPPRGEARKNLCHRDLKLHHGTHGAARDVFQARHGDRQKERQPVQRRDEERRLLPPGSCGRN